jgi:hypothetical protein
MNSRIILAFVKPADDDGHPCQTKYFKFNGLGKLERVNYDGSLLRIPARTPLGKRAIPLQTLELRFGRYKPPAMPSATSG